MKQSAVLLSGLLCDETFWTDIPRRLAAVAEIQVVSFRGFSSIPDMAQHVLDIAPQRFAVAGHSMGGRVALEIMRSAPSAHYGTCPAQYRRARGARRRAAKPRPLAASRL